MTFRFYVVKMFYGKIKTIMITYLFRLLTPFYLPVNLFLFLPLKLNFLLNFFILNCAQVSTITNIIVSGYIVQRQASVLFLQTFEGERSYGHHDIQKSGK